MHVLVNVMPRIPFCVASDSHNRHWRQTTLFVAKEVFSRLVLACLGSGCCGHRALVNDIF